MKVVPEELRALIPPVPIVNPEEGALRPVIDLALLALRFHYVQYDCYTVLIVVSTCRVKLSCCFLPDYTLVCICTIGRDDAVFLAGIFGGLKA